MAYIGNTQLNQNYVPAVDFFSGNGSTTAFTLSRPVASVAAIQAVISNVPQDPGTAFTVSGSTITFTSAPPSGTANIYVYYTSPNTSVATLAQSPVITGNLNMGSTGARITGDFSNATIANRVMFQSSVLNGSTSVEAIPNGSSTTASFIVSSSSSDPANSSLGNILMTGSEFRLQSTIRGTGTYLPMTFVTGSVERMRIDTSGNVGIGTSNPSQKLHVSGGLVQIVRNTQNMYLNPDYNAAGTTSSISYDSGKALAFIESSTERMRIDSSGNLLFNSGYGSVATAYGCRAWVNFNGTGTVAIRGSGNVTSITDNGTGAYVVNMTNAMPDTNYAPISCGNNTAGSAAQNSMYNSTPVTTSTFTVNIVTNGGGPRDDAVVTSAVFR